MLLQNRTKTIICLVPALMKDSRMGIGDPVSHAVHDDNHNSKRNNEDTACRCYRHDPHQGIHGIH